MNRARKEGFTLIELLIVIGIIAVLAAIVLVATDPAKRFAESRDSRRSSSDRLLIRLCHNRLWGAPAVETRVTFYQSCEASPTFSRNWLTGGLAGCNTVTWAASSWRRFLV